MRSTCPVVWIGTGFLRYGTHTGRGAFLRALFIPSPLRRARHAMIAARSLSSSRSFSGLQLPADLHRPSSPLSVVTVRSPRAAVSASYAAERERQSAQAGSAAACVAMAAVASAPSLYELLGIHATASGQEVKAAYRRLARACHPDVVAVDRKDSSADRFMRIHAAYLTLSDPERRADYDRSLATASDRRVMFRSSSFSPSSSSSSYSSSPRGSSSFSGYTTRRNWETDQCW